MSSGQLADKAGPTTAVIASVVMATRCISMEGRGLWEEGGVETGRRGRAGQRGWSYNQAGGKWEVFRDPGGGGCV